MSPDNISPDTLESIAARLRPVCPDVPEEEFRKLVVDVARLKLKYGGDQFANLVQRGESANDRAQTG